MNGNRVTNHAHGRVHGRDCVCERCFAEVLERYYAAVDRALVEQEALERAQLAREAFAAGIELAEDRTGERAGRRFTLSYRIEP